MILSILASLRSDCALAAPTGPSREPDAKIRAVRDFETSALFTEAECAALTLAFQASIVPNAVEEADMQAVKAHFDGGEIVEIVGSIALFGYLNRWNDTMATDLEAPALSLAQRVLSPVAWDAGKHGGAQ